MKGLAAYGELLRRAGVEVVFSMLGGSNVSWMGLAEAGHVLRVVKTRHEETAVQAAMGYARATGRVGVCSVTRGPGFANAIAGLIAATKTSVPIVLFTGQSPSPNPVTTQNVPQRELVEIIGAGFWHANDASELADVVFGAIACARDIGVPQVVSTNEACQAQDVDIGDRVIPARARPEPRGEDVRQAVELLASARRPLVLAGQGAVISDCRDDVLRLADMVGADVASTLFATRYFSGHPRDLGVCGGWSTPLSHWHLTGHDLILGLGASLNPFTMDHGLMSEGATLVQCTLDPGRVAPLRPPDLLLEADVGAAARALIAEWIASGAKAKSLPGIPPMSEQRQSVLDSEVGHVPQLGLDPRRVVAAFDAKLPADRIAVTDSGRTAAMLTAMVDARDPRSFLLGRAYGVVGLGIGTAIGAAVAQPDRRVVLFAGDGGFMMGLSGLDTVRMHGLDNLAIVVLDDQQYGGDAVYLKKFGLPMDLIRQSIPDVGALAAVYGGEGVVVATEEDLSSLTFPPRGLFIVDARTDPSVHPQHALAHPPDATAALGIGGRYSTGVRRHSSIRSFEQNA